MVQSRLSLLDNETDTEVAIILIDLERLQAYKKILNTPMPPDAEDKMGHKITAPVKNKKTIEAKKRQFVIYLMHRTLEMNGDL